MTGKRELERRIEELEPNVTDLPKVGVPVAFELLDVEWKWLDRDRRILQTEDGKQYYDSRELLSN